VVGDHFDSSPLDKAESLLQTSIGQAGGEMNPFTSLVTAIPNQGMLGPYEKIPVFFRFSPR
jgi:hypothetical protein